MLDKSTNIIYNYIVSFDALRTQELEIDSGTLWHRGLFLYIILTFSVFYDIIYTEKTTRRRVNYGT